MVRTVEISETLMPDDLTPTEPEGESDALVAAIATEVSDGASSAGQDASPSAPLVEIGAYRRRLAPILVAAAAVVDGDDAREGVLIALSATDLAPGAAAEADIADSPLGRELADGVSLRSGLQLVKVRRARRTEEPWKLIEAPLGTLTPCSSGHLTAVRNDLDQGRARARLPNGLTNAG